MIQLTKINGEKILINPIQIEFIESIPESKIVMMNGRYHIVSESQDKIMELSSEFYKGLVEINRDHIGITKNLVKIDEKIQNIKE